MIKNITKKQKYLLDLLSNKKVLYAEDEQGIQNNVVQVLELFFNSVITVNDGEEALDEYVSHKPDVIILDICMPKLDGLEVVKSIRSENKKIPIIILSAYTDKDYLWRAIEQKICKFLTKPFHKEQFIEALELAALELSNYTTNNTTIPLSKIESKMIDFLLSRENQVITYDEIFDYIWANNEQPTKDAIKAIIKDLRKIFGKSIIQNIFGVGYKLEI